MSEQTPDIKALVRKLERRHKKKQATTALLAGTGILATFVVLAPLFTREAPQAIVEAPVAVPTQEPSRAFESVAIEGKAAIVYDLATGEVLYEKQSRSQLPLASLTKLLTVYAASQALSDSASVAITDTALLPEGDNGLMVGEQFSFAELAKYALVGSSNDATAAIAEAASIARATSGKNLLAGAASAAGLSQTYAINGTGLDESSSISGGYGSAHDIALLAGALIEEAPDIARATTETSYQVVSNMGIAHEIANTNADVVRVPNLLLSKTGFTDLAGGNLAIVYDAGINHPVAIVVLGSSREGRFSDVNTLLNRASEHFAGLKP